MIRAVFRFIFSTFFWICALIGFIIFGVGVILYLGKTGPFSSSPKHLDKDVVLSLTLNGQYIEHAGSKGLGALLLGKNASLYDLTQAITQGAQDKKVKGLIVRLETPNLGAAQIQELRDSLLAFRKTGKTSICYTDTFGELSSGTALYYLATACQEIWIQPLGTVNLTGLHIEVPFGKEALEKLAVKPEIAQRKEYKSYPEMFTREDFSESSREALQAIADSISSQFVDGIAKERNITHENVRFLINNGPYLTHEAKSLKLIDRIDYRQNIIPFIKEKLGPKVTFVGIDTYLNSHPQEVKGNKVALIFGSGPIQRDGSGDPLLDEMAITSNSTYKAFKLAIEDKDVKTIVYRINSEGGSAIASETISSIIHYAQDHAKKPVIISMSNAAASGGYWIAVAGAKIVAQPATLTGSIGVFGGKFILSGLFDKVGIKWGRISTSENANMWSVNEAYTPAEWLKLNAMMDEIYSSFTSRVAKGRKMSPEQVEKVARGRVWTGEQALALGLVDQLGGLQVAIDLAKKEVNLPADAPVQVFPPEKSFLESLSSIFEKNEEDSLYEIGIFGKIFAPLRKIWDAFVFLLSSQELLYRPVGEVR